MAWFAAGGWGFVPLFVVFGLLPLVIWGPDLPGHRGPHLTRRQAWALGLTNWPYAGVHYISTWWAFTRIVRARHDWKKTARVLHRTYAARQRDRDRSRSLPAPDRQPIPAAGTTVLVHVIVTGRFRISPSTTPLGRDHEDVVAA